MFDWNPYYWWVAYFWPSDKGNGPENLQWTALAISVTALLVPVVRKALKREAEKLHAKMDHLHDKVDHVIFHSKDVPPFPGDPSGV